MCKFLVVYHNLCHFLFSYRTCLKTISCSILRYGLFYPVLYLFDAHEALGLVWHSLCIMAHPHRMHKCGEPFLSSPLHLSRLWSLAFRCRFCLAFGFFLFGRFCEIGSVSCFLGVSEDSPVADIIDIYFFGPNLYPFPMAQTSFLCLLLLDLKLFFWYWEGVNFTRFHSFWTCFVLLLCCLLWNRNGFITNGNYWCELSSLLSNSGCFLPS